MDRILKPYLSPVVNLSQPESLNGLAERIVAVESLVFLSKQYEFLQAYLEHLVLSQNKKLLQQFYNQVSHNDFPQFNFSPLNVYITCTYFLDNYCSK